MSSLPISSHDFTQLLSEWSNGNQEALERLMPLVYQELRKLAHQYLRKEGKGCTIQTSDLVHEAYLRLVDQREVNWQNRAHFFGIASELMRRIIVDRARRRRRVKRGGGATPITLDQSLAMSEPAVDVIAIDEALDKLALIDERKARIVELRFFGGLEVDETAAFLKSLRRPSCAIGSWRKHGFTANCVMNPERWQKLDELFHSALEHRGDARAAFLAAACDRDDELLQELESMLTHHQQAEDFMELPAYGIEAQSLVSGERSSQTLVGKTLGPYDVLGELGRGGMGEIYLAFDNNLQRQVALKFLRDDLTADKPRLRRFNQEARAASALNHPNILTIYEAGELEGLQFIATEFVEGRTLREVMSSAQLNVGQILDIANQIASALLTAHSAAIVHRDIKPENLMVRPDGYIKIVDFGVAKLIEKQATDDNEPTAFKTEKGVTVGTVCYMSPEQVRALEVDERTDVWSLGVVLYEMLAGKRPFEGETSGDVIANILKSEPTPLLLPETPGWTKLERLIEKALTKDRRNRSTSMAELLTDLREIKLQPELMPQVARITGNKKRRSKGLLILLIGLMSSLLLVGGYRLYRYRELRGQTATVVHPSQMTVRRFTTYGGLPLRAAISPDGQSLAYIQRLNNKNSLWLGDVDTNNSSPLYQQADLEVVEPTFAPDGNSIYFITGGEQHPNGMLKRMSVSGGDVIDLIPNVQSPVALSD